MRIQRLAKRVCIAKRIMPGGMICVIDPMDLVSLGGLSYEENIFCFGGEQIRCAL